MYCSSPFLNHVAKLRVLSDINKKIKIKNKSILLFIIILNYYIMQTTVKERLMQFIDKKKISKNKFEKLAGLSTGYLNQLRHSPSADKVKSILVAFPELNQTWLLTGEGEMLVGDNKPVNVINGVTQGDNSEINQGCSPCEDTDDICSDLRAEIQFLREQNRKLLAMVERLMGK